MPPFACVISFLMTGHRSVYPSQVLLVKNPIVDVNVGHEMHDVKVVLNLRKQSWSRASKVAYGVIKGWFHQEKKG